MINSYRVILFAPARVKSSRYKNILWQPKHCRNQPPLTRKPPIGELHELQTNAPYEGVQGPTGTHLKNNVMAFLWRGCSTPYISLQSLTQRSVRARYKATFAVSRYLPTSWGSSTNCSPILYLHADTIEYNRTRTADNNDPLYQRFHSRKSVQCLRLSTESGSEIIGNALKIFG